MAGHHSLETSKTAQIGFGPHYQAIAPKEMEAIAVLSKMPQWWGNSRRDRVSNSPTVFIDVWVLRQLAFFLPYKIEKAIATMSR